MPASQRSLLRAKAENGIVGLCRCCCKRLFSYASLPPLAYTIASLSGPQHHRANGFVQEHNGPAVFTSLDGGLGGGKHQRSRLCSAATSVQFSGASCGQSYGLRQQSRSSIKKKISCKQLSFVEKVCPICPSSALWRRPFLRPRAP